MEAATQIYFIDPSDIIIGERQRKEKGDIEALAASILKLGQLQPIVISKSMTLHVGERRTLACKFLGIKVKAVFIEDLPPIEAKLVELEENLYRKEYTWQEECLAVLEIHELCSEANEEWTMDATAERLGLGRTTTYRYVSLGRAIPEYIELAGCDTIGSAWNILQRRQARAIDHEVSRFIDSGGTSLFEDPLEPTSEDAPPEPIFKTIDHGADSVTQADFFKWAAAYSGQPFDFIHLDPPYGINMHDSHQGGAARAIGYEDSMETYFAFLACLRDNAERLFAYKSHVMIWFSMNYYASTMLTLNEIGQSLNRETRIQVHPLIWYKSDNAGIIPDGTRAPRRVYETALVASFGDRKIVKPQANVAAHHGHKRGLEIRHLSQKPIAMLHHFFQMFADPSTRFLDPCCGSGTSLAAAELLGADVTGLDIEQEYVEESIALLNRTRLGGSLAMQAVDTEES